MPVVGVLMAPPRFEVLLDVSRFPAGTAYGVVETDGTVVCSVPDIQQWTRIRFDGVPGRETARWTDATEGVKRLYGSSEFRGSHCQALVDIPNGGICAPACSLAVRNMVIAQAMMLSVGVFDWFMARRIARPIGTIADVARSVARGRAHVRGSLYQAATVGGRRETVQHHAQFPQVGERLRASSNRISA